MTRGSMRAGRAVRLRRFARVRALRGCEVDDFPDTPIEQAKSLETLLLAACQGDRSESGLYELLQSIHAAMSRWAGCALAPRASASLVSRGVISRHYRPAPHPWTRLPIPLAETLSKRYAHLPRCHLRRGHVSNRRQADIADRDGERRDWADSGHSLLRMEGAVALKERTFLGSGSQDSLQPQYQCRTRCWTVSRN